ncbi:hypothetical protein A6P39_015525 [Streptomyces sp. FXJ1.172]|uniref:hypothetical protein n=1 Tax=Streptomyces sp. FXJ1.172 TaxID=710705 RepID=UPI0009A08157|nr:hypothetical protein [Streptomyces sp. FXJ1.172]WEO95322.1 hypothetical protein A6P39_015525 [Streptomyces sp. FXJ1.172]
MDWIPLLSTAFGAVIGVVATLLADRVRARSNRQEEDRALKRRLYGDYLAALSLTRQNLRTAARSLSVSHAERTRMALDSFKEASVYQARYQVSLVAHERVVEASTAAFNALRSLRDLVEAGGGSHGDPAYRAAQNEWTGCFATLRRCMRRDLDS